MPGTRQAASTDTKVLNRIRSATPGWVFTAGDFADLGSSQAVRHAITRLARTGRIRRLTRGLYEVPRSHPRLGTLSPSLEEVLRALRERYSCRLLPAGAYAANLLGLSEQVPGRIVFLTDGNPRTITLGKREVVLRRSSTRALATAGRPSGLVIQALRHLGRRAVDASVIEQVRKGMSRDDLRSLREDARFAPEWIARVLRQLSASTEGAAHDEEPA